MTDARQRYVEALRRAAQSRRCDAREARYGTLPPQYREPTATRAEADVALLLALADALERAEEAWIHRDQGFIVFVDPDDEDTHDYSKTGDGKWRLERVIELPEEKCTTP